MMRQTGGNKLRDRFGVHHLAQTLNDMIAQQIPREQMSRGFIDHNLTLHTEGGALQFPRGHYDSIIDLDQVQAGDQVIVSYLLGQEAVVIGKSYRDSKSTQKVPYVGYTGTVKGLDTSSQVTTPWLQAVWDLGIRLVAIPGVASPPLGALNGHLFSDVAACVDFGMPIGVYVRPPDRWEEVLDELDPPGQEQLSTKIVWLALDVEQEANATYPMTQAHVDGVIARGVTPIVATARGLWPGIMGQQTAFSDLGLWDSDASNNNGTYHANNWPDAITDRPFVSYGGWTSRMGWQFAWNVDFPPGSGMNCDLDLFATAGGAGISGAFWPVPGTPPGDWEITQLFGYDPSYNGNSEHFHYGLDIVTKRSFRGEYAIAGGTVAQIENGVAGQTGIGYGNFVEVDHGDGVMSRYAHMTQDSIVVSVGDVVVANQLLGEEGNTGDTLPPGGGFHLHLEIRVNGKAVDPLPYIDGKTWELPPP